MAEKQTNKDRMREIVDSIENGIKELFESDKYRKYLATMSRFHRYSVNNTMLIYMQRPDATHVAGFNKWRDQFGRNVLKGEKGIRIIAPTPYKKKVEEIKTDPETNAPILDADGKAIIEEKEIRIPMFKVVSVFDVSQTAGKPLPQLAADLSGNVQQYEVFMEALRRASPVPMEIKPVARDTDGFFSIKAQSITIRAGMSEVQTVCAAVHEIAHAKLHDYEHMTELADDGETILVPGEKSRNTEEVEAESISYAVCQYYGIETGENSFGYIATWSKGKELKELRASLETINKTASELIMDIDRHFAEICKERGINREEVSATQADEALYLVDDSVYLHVQHTDGGWDYSLYDKESKKLLDGGVIDSSAIEDSPVASVAGAVRTEVFAIQGMTPTKVTFADMKILEDLQEAQITPPLDSEQITSAVAVPTDAADNMLPELEQAVPMPDPTLTVDDMRNYGYLDSDMLPLSKDRAVELLEHDITVYMQTLAAHPLPAEGFVGMEIRGDRLTDKENAGAALLDTCKEVKGKDPVQIGSYRGFTMSVAFDSMWKTYTLTLKGRMTHRVELGSDARGNLVRIENALDKMPERLRSVQEQLENLYNQQAAAKAEVGKPFPQEQELAAKTARLIELDMELNLDGKGQPQPEQAIAKSARPSVLDRLKAPPVHSAPEKPHKKEMEAR